MTQFKELRHKHKLVLAGHVLGEYGGNYPLYWCLECGMLVERFATDNCATMVPEMTKDVAAKAKGVEYVPKAPPRTPATRVLGRSLADLMIRPYAEHKKLAEIMRLPVKGGSK